jgi:hypothetical protein
MSCLTATRNTLTPRDLWPSKKALLAVSNTGSREGDGNDGHLRVHRGRVARGEQGKHSAKAMPREGDAHLLGVEAVPHGVGPTLLDNEEVACLASLAPWQKEMKKCAIE